MLAVEITLCPPWSLRAAMAIPRLRHRAFAEPPAIRQITTSPPNTCAFAADIHSARSGVLLYEDP